MVNRGVSLDPEQRRSHYESIGKEAHNDSRSRAIISKALEKGFKSIRFNINAQAPSFELHWGEQGKSAEGWMDLEKIETQDELTKFLTRFNVEVSFDPDTGKMRAGGPDYDIDAVDRINE